MKITDLTMVEFDIDGNTHLYKFEETENGVVLQEKIYNFQTAKRNYLATEEKSEITFDYLWDMEVTSENEYTGEEILPFLYIAHPEGLVHPSYVYEIIKEYWDNFHWSRVNREGDIHNVAEVCSYSLYKEGVIQNLCDYICAKYTTNPDGDVELHLYKLKEEREPGSLIKEIVIPESKFIRENKRAILEKPLFNIEVSEDGDFWYDNAELVQDTTYSLDAFLTMELNYMEEASDVSYRILTYDLLYSSMYGAKRIGINRLCMLDYDFEHIYIYSLIPSKDKIDLEKRTINMKQICTLIQMLRPSTPHSWGTIQNRLLKERQTEFWEIIEDDGRICTRQEFIDIIRSNHVKMASFPCVMDALVNILDMYRKNRLFSEYTNSNIQSIYEESFKHSKYPFYFHESLKSIKNLTFLRYEHDNKRLLCYRIRGISDDGALKVEKMAIPSEACCVVRLELYRIGHWKSIWAIESYKKETVEFDMDEFFTMGFNTIRNEKEHNSKYSIDIVMLLNTIECIS